jgi:hypothetical protein
MFVIPSAAPRMSWSVAAQPQGAGQGTYVFRPYVPLPFVHPEEIPGAPEQQQTPQIREVSPQFAGAISPYAVKPVILSSAPETA